MTNLRKDAHHIMQAALASANPDHAVKEALKHLTLPADGRLVLVALGKAAWQMAKAAHEALHGRIDRGIIITKHGHAQGALPGLVIREAGHPVPDEHSFAATGEALAMVAGLSPQDVVLLLVSGGGSALFEQPTIPPAELMDITHQLLRSGADIVQMNTIRKRLSRVKGGRFALACAPAQVFSVVLSDIIGDPLDMIASGPAYPDASTSEQALDIAERYGLTLSAAARDCLKQETPKELHNVETHITGSVRVLCDAAAEAASALGYRAQVLTDSLNCEAREAGSFLAAMARYHQPTTESLCFIAGGETVVRLTGKGKGGRNQEIALAGAQGIAGLRDTAVFSLGSDGTDGPTDAAGGYADGFTAEKLAAKGIQIHEVLKHNDAYHALQAVDGLIITGPTGTNVNDISVVLLKR